MALWRRPPTTCRWWSRCVPAPFPWVVRPHPPLHYPPHYSLSRSRSHSLSPAPCLASPSLCCPPPDCCRCCWHRRLCCRPLCRHRPAHPLVCCRLCVRRPHYRSDSCERRGHDRCPAAAANEMVRDYCVLCATDRLPAINHSSASRYGRLLLPPLVCRSASHGSPTPPRPRCPSSSNLPTGPTAWPLRFPLPLPCLFRPPLCCPVPRPRPAAA